MTTTEAEELKQDWRDEIYLPAQHKAMINMLGQFEQMWDSQLGLTRAAKHRIELTFPDSHLIHSAPYWAGPKGRSFEKDEIDKMVALKVIESAQTKWPSPIMSSTKKDGSLWFCTDYRKLNAVTAHDSYQISRMDECIDSLREASVFTTLDTNSGY